MSIGHGDMMSDGSSVVIQRPPGRRRVDSRDSRANARMRQGGRGWH